ncbi:hypothetical protein LVD13_08630 [Flavobacteriaceae bacterium D16]|nr:hypothetical protein [Flavobacteriaceae bacterium D16]
MLKCRNNSDIVQELSLYYRYKYTKRDILRLSSSHGQEDINIFLLNLINIIAGVLALE